MRLSQIRPKNFQGQVTRNEQQPAPLSAPAARPPGTELPRFLRKSCPALHAYPSGKPFPFPRKEILSLEA